ncbi:MAG: hypothetical protein HOQ35_15425 [Acidobacteriaceae bacterium]|nr:hypothetical protein [Acidobacteriaceae bacterium]
MTDRACAGVGVIGGCKGPAEYGLDAERVEGIATHELGGDQVGLTVDSSGHLDVFEGEEVLEGITLLAQFFKNRVGER